MRIDCELFDWNLSDDLTDRSDAPIRTGVVTSDEARSGLVSLSRQELGGSDDHHTGDRCWNKGTHAERRVQIRHRIAIRLRTKILLQHPPTIDGQTDGEKNAEGDGQEAGPMTKPSSGRFAIVGDIYGNIFDFLRILLYTGALLFLGCSPSERLFTSWQPRNSGRICHHECRPWFCH
jgi:hypothetical protein